MAPELSVGLYPNYAPLPVNFVRGRAEFLFDASGKEYIDLLAGIAVTSVGHCHPRIVEALTLQAQGLWHVSNLYEASWQKRLATRLLKLSAQEPSQLTRAFFCNSGTEANEAAFKLSRIYGQSISPQKFKIVSLQGSFHGRTLASACLTGQKKGQELMGPLPEGFVSIDPNDLGQLEAAIDEHTCALFVEAVLGEGGVLPLEELYLRRAQELCRRYKALLVCDEVQIGVFRSGSFWGHQRLGVVPDVVTSAKGLGGGFPIGAMLSSEALSGLMPAGTHGSTFGGNALAATVANAVLEVLEENDAGARVREMESLVLERMNRLQAKFPDVIIEHRGLGLLHALVLRDDLLAQDYVKKGLELGLVWGTAGKHVLRFAPSLLIERASLERAFDLTEAMFL